MVGAAAGVLAVVIWIKWPVGWLYSNTGGGWEHPLFWLIAQSALMLAGGGAFALQGKHEAYAPSIQTKD